MRVKFITDMKGKKTISSLSIVLLEREGAAVLIDSTQGRQAIAGAVDSQEEFQKVKPDSVWL